MNKRYLLTITAALALTSCSDGATYTEKASPSNLYKDYDGSQKSVLGVGKTISERKAESNATISFRGNRTLEDSIAKFASKYALSVEWDGDLNKSKYARLMASKQTFNEARTYLEEVYDVSIVRVRDRAIKVMTPTTVQKLESFNPGPNVRLSEAVDGLAGLCGINLVIAEHKSVLATQKLTTNLKDITCSQAFEAILSPFGLSLQKNGNHYTIAGLPFREWVLNLHEQDRIEKQKVSYASEFSGSSGEESGSSNYVSGGTSSTETEYKRNLWTSLEKDLDLLVQKSCENAGTMGYDVAQAGNSQMMMSPEMQDPNMMAMAQPMQAQQGSEESKKKCGYVRVNPDIGLVQMQAPSSVIEKANDMILTFEEIASRRLLVEARILAVSKARSFDRGADLNARGSVFGTDFAFGFNPANALEEGVSVAGTLNDIIGASGGGSFGLKSDNLDAVVRYVQSFGTTYQLMKPTLEVMDRQKATLIDGRNERYFIRTATVDNSGDTPVVTTEAEEKVQFIGIQFTVSAQIAEEGDGLHTVALQIPITEISRYEKLENRAGTNEDLSPIILTDLIPIATTRVIDQKVRLRDGEIKVIGGLTKTIAVDKETGVPLLEDVPVAGKAFSEESVTYEDVEFVVLLQVKRLDSN